MENNSQRFTNSAPYFQGNRPSYPPAVLQFLQQQAIIGPDKVIADVGSGTGIFTELLLQSGGKVIGLEPNLAMRRFADKNLSDHPNFSSINALAENTGLENDAVDTLTVASAFHWFERDACRDEFHRIVKPGGYIVLIWNLRNPEFSPLLADYDELIRRHCPSYDGLPSAKITQDDLADFLAPGSLQFSEFDNTKLMDRDGLIGRLLSCSYALKPQDSGYDAMLNDINALFEQYQDNGQVAFPYKTKLFYAKL